MLLGLDLGTTNVKALLAAPDGRVVGRGTAPVPLYHLPDGGVEQDIEEIWTAVLQAIAGALAGHDASAVRAVGVSSQGGALQFADKAQRPWGRVIGWLDRRGQLYDTALTAELGHDWFVRHVGHGCSALPVGQILRLRAAGILPPAFRVGFVGDAVVARLCGRPAHDATSLSLAMLYNPSLRRADPELLTRLGIGEEQLPELLPAHVAAGTLVETVARHTGLPPGIPVSTAIHDQYAAALGAQALSSGDVMVGTGTAWVLLAAAERLSAPAISSAFVCTHLLDGLYGQILSLGNGGSAVSWALALLGLEKLDNTGFDDLTAAVPPGSDGLRFWPFLGSVGEGLPAETAGRLAGLRMAHTAADLLRAVIEGLTCELARYVRLASEAGLPMRRLVLCGRAARSRVTPQIIADVTGLEVLCVAEADTSALGAVILAQTLQAPGTSLRQAAEAMNSERRRLQPGPHRAAYAALFEEYLASLPPRSCP